MLVHRYHFSGTVAQGLGGYTLINKRWHHGIIHGRSTSRERPRSTTSSYRRAIGGGGLLKADAPSGFFVPSKISHCDARHADVLRGEIVQESGGRPLTNEYLLGGCDEKRRGLAALVWRHARRSRHRVVLRRITHVHIYGTGLHSSRY